MHLQMLSSAAVLKPGDQLATSASVKDRPYVPGVPIGVITKLINVNGALTEAALVRPYVDYTGLAHCRGRHRAAPAQPALRGAATVAAPRAYGHRYGDGQSRVRTARLVADPQARRLKCARSGCPGS